MTESTATQSPGVTAVPGRHTSLVARVLIAPIVAYRRWISPVLPPRCRFYPSCSAYAIEAISTHGVLKGLGLATWRLLRCQPFCAGGYDPVPPPNHRSRSQSS